MLNWGGSKYNEVCVKDKKGYGSITLVRGENGGIIAEFFGKRFRVDPKDISYVLLDAPGFFKSGMVAFFDSDGDVLEYVVEGDTANPIPLVVLVGRKDKEAFYFACKVFKDNGFDCHIC